ncbi:hypothetical protein P691DRAFT_760992 [Macrolepiota fuliginosa MF-IS2]|uniref:Uncharacterized protein n=1 Tax=Macrolepiota fuliginosa MF-IS2 TaxID=1400762 RepID=A0A9P5XA07_9AGAR|nr:hypothetical protein P691DRAFT_760992 [Macrolepiota fuliginosa MF-IS2]
MAYKVKPRKLSVIIPPTPVSTQTATETTVDGSKAFSHFPHKPYCSPVSPLKHPYRPRMVAFEPESPAGLKAASHADLNMGPRAEDIASPDLLAVANLFASMKETLNRMTKAFDTIGEQSQRLSSLPGEVRRVEDLRAAKAELEEQITRQRMAMQKLHKELEGEVRIALENNLRERLTSMIQESVAKEVKDRVHQELALQIPHTLHAELMPSTENEVESPVHQEGPRTDADTDTSVLSPTESSSYFPKIPILLYQEPTDDEADYLETPQDDLRMDLNTPIFSAVEHVHSAPKISILLFDESREHEPPPPSPAPMAGPLRPLLRPLPTPEQSPAYVVNHVLPSRSASVCPTPITAYPRVPAPTPITNEPTLMVLPMKGVPASALSPMSASPLAPRDFGAFFSLSSEGGRELLKAPDIDGYAVPTPMAEWPKTRTIDKTPASLRASPLMIPPPIETNFINMEHERYDVVTPVAPPETPMLIVPPPLPKPLPRAGNSFADNLKLLPPLIIN